jgi:hypothetical protein
MDLATLSPQDREAHLDALAFMEAAIELRSENLQPLLAAANKDRVICAQAFWVATLREQEALRAAIQRCRYCALFGGDPLASLDS